ncbi:MAG: phosphoribosyltransferase [Deltaproteobacteria bacterium]|nr:phosphoribosyltransferase [Deltaproteobacteria bacterium]
MNQTDIYKNHFPKAIRLSWEEVEGLLWKIFVDLRSSGYIPDVVISVARGGLAPARILGDYLQQKYICTLQMGHWDKDAQLTESPVLIYPLPEVDLSKQKIVVVDDISDEGMTMEKVAEYLSTRVGDIRTAVLVSKTDSHFMADFCPKVIDEWRWVFFPWSIHEDLVVFTEKVLQLTGGSTIEEIIRILEESMTVEFATDEIEKVLYDMYQAGEIAEDVNNTWSLI